MQDHNWLNAILNLINDKEMMVELKSNILKTGNRDADKKIATEILKAFK